MGDMVWCKACKKEVAGEKVFPTFCNGFISSFLSSHELASDCSLLCGEAFRKDTSEEHLDPSVFISDYINGLLKSGHDDETTTKVFETAINIMASMKGDWVQTGRKHSVVCRAAIYIAALSHDIGEEKITKMMNEIANTEVESITVEELKKIDSILLKKPFTPRPNSDKEVVNCKHKDSRSVGYGLCKNCHVKFTQVYADACLSEESEASDDLDDGPVAKRQKRAEVAKNAPPA